MRDRLHMIFFCFESRNHPWWKHEQFSWNFTALYRVRVLTPVRYRKTSKFSNIYTSVHLRIRLEGPYLFWNQSVLFCFLLNGLYTSRRYVPCESKRVQLPRAVYSHNKSQQHAKTQVRAGKTNRNNKNLLIQIFVKNFTQNCVMSMC